MPVQGTTLDDARVEHFRHALGPFVVAAETTRMPTAFTSAGPDHEILFANESFLKLTGYRHAEAIGEPFSRLLTGAKKGAAAKLIDGQFDAPDDPIIVTCRRKDGGRVRTLLSVVAVHDRQDNVVQYSASLLDLSAQAKRHRRDRAALHALLQETPDFIAMTDGPDHRFTFVNAAYQKLVGDRDLLGRPLAEAIPELARQANLKDRDRAFRSGKLFAGSNVAVQLQREPGADVETLYLNLIYQPITARDGSVTGIFCEGHDVTEHKEVSDRLQALQIDLVHLTRLSAMGTMAATLAHEMTQPLTAIANYAAACDIVNDRDGDNRTQVKTLLKSISDAVSRGTDVIERLQRLTERRKTSRHRFQLKDAIRESIAMVRASAYGNATIVDRSGPTTELDADRIQIEQVLINLIRNGCEALGSEDGRVTVSTTAKDDMIVVSIKDTGLGVAPDARKKLFQWSDSTKPNGTGIGLSICRTIIESHGGDLWLKASGHTGSCFAFSLPLHNAPVAARAARVPATPSPAYIAAGAGSAGRSPSPG
ncbi:MAG: ATP-binding protein [Pseudomonadota bacterium]